MRVFWLGGGFRSVAPQTLKVGGGSHRPPVLADLLFEAVPELLGCPDAVVFVAEVAGVVVYVLAAKGEGNDVVDDICCADHSWIGVEAIGAEVVASCEAALA